jgi:riboflavin kinase/FMN adenylyltransferase
MLLHDPETSIASALQVCRDGEPVPASLQGSVAAIGNFDGVHRGHQALIQVAHADAEAAGRPSAVLTFEPHPRALFRPEAPLFRLTPETVKLALFAGHQALCRDHGLSCSVVPVVADGDEVVSSSAVRAALERGDVAAANRLLGYRWFVRGEVRHGQKRGRTLGYPTANLRLADDCRLRHGIYAVRASLGPGAVYEGVASFGRRPTFDNGAPLLEAFLFDFAGDLYGRLLDIELVGWIRGEERFDSAEALVERMHRDSEEARALLKADRVPSVIG